VPQGADSLIASDTFYIGGIAGNDHPTVKVYGGGRVEVYFPAYMARSGNYELQLDEADLNNLVNSLIANGLLEFDAARVRADIAALKAQARARGELHHVSDPSTTVTDLHLESRQLNRKIHSSARWKGLVAHLRQYPGQADLQGLAAARESLTALAEHPGLVKMEEERP
jgi:hypothetical protein